MKIVLIVLLCLLLTMSIQTQTTNEKKTEIKVTKLALAKEDKDGNIIEDTELFSPKDIPIYCYIDLNSKKPTMVKMVIIAVKAIRIRPNSKIITVQYKTKSGENEVSFNAKPRKVWAEGDYRVDVYLNGKLSKSKEFKVEKQIPK